MRTGPAASSRSSSAGSGSRRAAGGCVPSRRGDEERALEVHAEDARPARLASGTSAQRRERAPSSGAVISVGRKEVTPVSSSASPARAYPSASASRKSTPPKPFTCRSTKPGAAMPRPFEPLRPTRGDTAVGDLHVARNESPPTSAASTPSLIDERQPHVAAGRLEPRRARPPRRRPPSSETIATFASPPAADERASDLLVGAPVASATMRRTRARSFSFVGDDVHHQVAVRLAEPDHRDRRERVEDELLRGAGLQPGRARDHLGPDDDRDLTVGQRGRARESGRADDADRQRARMRGPPRARRARTAFGRSALIADDGVVARGASALELARTGVGVVLGRLLLERRAQQSRRRRARRRARLASRTSARTRRRRRAASRPDVPAPT